MPVARGPRGLGPRQLGQDRARTLRAKWGNPQLPITDLSNEIYSQTSIWVIRLPLKGEVDGGIFGRAGVRVMLINTRERGLGKQRATAAHELGHHLEDETRDFAELIDDRRPTEGFAEGFAIELLAPQNGVREWAKNQGLTPNEVRPSHASQLASYYRISYEMACMRLRAAGLVRATKVAGLIGGGGRAAAFEGAAEAWYDENIRAKNGFELPAAYVGRARAAFTDGIITQNRLAELEFREPVELERALKEQADGQTKPKPDEKAKAGATAR